MTNDNANITAATDAQRLATLEAIIQNGLRTFIEVGNALLEIRDERLYREQGFKTFEDYCQKRWGWGRNYANKQIIAAEVIQNLGTNVPKPKNEAQARELARLPVEQQREIAATIDFSTATAAEIRQQVRGLTAHNIVYFEIPTDHRDSIAFHPAYAYRDAVDFDFVDRLARSIGYFGQIHPILTMPDRRIIIDGRSRFLASGRAGVSTWCRVWDGGTSMQDILEVILILHQSFKPYTRQERHKVFRELEA
jgi:hypothetical protein